MEKILFDSHAHLNNESYSDSEREALIREIEASPIAYVCNIGFDLESSILAAKHAKKYDWCYAVCGVHPHEVKKMTDEQLDRLKELAVSEKKIVAIGEIGLDFHYDFSPRDEQRYWFRRQIRLANELKMPIVIHAREADREVMDILIEEGAFSDERKAMFDDGMPHVDIHCYSGSAEFSREYVTLGAVFGVDGPLTYKNNVKTVEFVQNVPLDRLLVETDAPYLSPVPFRGKPNKSPYVEYVLRKVAEIRGMSYEEVAEITLNNAKKFYRID